MYIEMSASAPGAAPPYIIRRTRFQSPMYDGAIDPLLADLRIEPGIWRASGATGLVVLRSTVMDPFLVAPPPAPDHIAGFIASLRDVCAQLAGTDGLTTARPTENLNR